MKNEMTVVGIRRVEFTTKDNVTIKGYSVYMTYHDENVLGLACCKEFISEAKFIDPVDVGDRVVVRYNRYGKVDYLEVL